MKKVMSAMIMVVFAASAAMAAAAPDTVTMTAKNGNVAFNHKAHAAGGDCKSCHGEGTPAKVDLDKAAAHKLCIDCHKAKSAGPTKCGECHKK
jgi:predicted CXXCH cytochrome family protein